MARRNGFSFTAGRRDRQFESPFPYQRVIQTRSSQQISTASKVAYEVCARISRPPRCADASIPAPEAQIAATAATPVFTTADDFATASLRLIAEKKYEGGEAEDEGA
jgi:ATP-dependent 26S proteasome regulatory subunit